jgi:hypothetical protein
MIFNQLSVEKHQKKHKGERMPDLGLLKINQLTNLPKPNTVAVGGLRFCTNNLTDENQGRIQL